MASKYLKGTIFKLHEDSDESYLIVSSEQIDEEYFLLVMPVDNIEKIVIDVKKLFLLRVSKDEEITIETDPELTEKVINIVMEKEKRREENLKK